METRPPTATRILIAVGFALSCFGLLLFLWIAFGGPVPLKSEGYRFQVPFNEATQLAVESDVRISGVSVGKVKRIDLADDGLAEATIELDARYSPIPSNTSATLRQKTLLGETYVELAPGDEESGMLAEGGDIPAAQVAPSVQLDEIFRAFDPQTREDFRTWMGSGAASLRGRGEDLSIAIASLEPFAEEVNTTLRALDSQDLAVQRLVRDGGEVFSALSERRGQLRGLIENSERVFSTTADRDAELAETFRVFPTFLRESRTTLARLETFARDTDPLVTQLRPAARELGPTFIALGELAPELRGFFQGFDRAIGNVSGFSALRELLDDRFPPLLDRLDPYLADLNSLLAVLRNYREEVAGTIANLAATTNGAIGRDPDGTLQRYLRTEAPLFPEGFAAFGRRLDINRTNPYVKPGRFAGSPAGFQVFEDSQCTGGIQAFLDPNTPNDPDFNVRTGGNVADAQILFDRISEFAFQGEQDTGDIEMLPCDKQGPYNSIGENPETSDYQHVREQP